MELHYLMLVLFAAAVVCAAEDDQQCSDLHNCQMHIDKLEKSMSGDEEDAVAENIKEVIACVEPALKTCEEEGGISEDIYSAMSAKLTQYKMKLTQLEAMSPENEVGGMFNMSAEDMDKVPTLFAPKEGQAKYNISLDDVPENPTCMDLQECAKGLEATENMDSLSESEKKNLCKIVYEKLECMEKATNKCMEMTLPEEAKESMRSGIIKGKEIYKQHCTEGDGVGANEFSWLFVAAGLLTTWQLQQQL
ncbi:hypothetical protein PoB_000986200 [Plakobranchus ocellatus]|uniref:Uncharacterized protein n=1 Tax=Plakobranchus ocellatus TaxID=259542 RepID=A0AAV3YKD2_9GAST|nr:hypothetical protein PoB_000986200 [Plakobranchus ocellatus]